MLMMLRLTCGFSLSCVTNLCIFFNLGLLVLYLSISLCSSLCGLHLLSANTLILAETDDVVVAGVAETHVLAQAPLATC